MIPTAWHPSYFICLQKQVQQKFSEKWDITDKKG
jgi:hypothetical protein